MAEKPRLKETDEIFSAIGKSPAKARPLPVSPVDAASGEEGDAGQSDSRGGRRMPSDGSNRRSSRTAGRRVSRAPSFPEEAEDPRPLDIEKYSLSQKSKDEKDAVGQDAPAGEESPLQIDDRKEVQSKELDAESLLSPQQGTRTRRRTESRFGEAVPAPQIRRVNPPADAKKVEYSPIQPVASVSAPASIEGPVEPPDMPETTKTPASQEGPVEPSNIRHAARAPASLEGPDVSEENQDGQALKRARPAVDAESAPVSAPIEAEQPKITASQREAKQYEHRADPSKRRNTQRHGARAPASQEGPVEPPQDTEERVFAPASKEGPVERPAKPAKKEQAPASQEGPVEPSQDTEERAFAPASKEGPVERPARTAKKEQAPASQEGPVEPRKPHAVRPFVFGSLSEESAMEPEEANHPETQEGKAPPFPEKQKHFQTLSSRFEEAFEEVFRKKEAGGKKLPPRPKAQMPVQETFTFEIPSEPFAPDDDPPEENPLPKDTMHEIILPEDPAPENPVPEDREASYEAESFLKEFAQRIKDEEEDRAEMFKDTLAEKFERERQRYLKEFMTGADSPSMGPEPEAFVPPAIRRLDIQIDPKMHRQPGEELPEKKADALQGGVTYSRGGAARPLSDIAEESSPDSGRPLPGGKKSAEQLLLELAMQKIQPAPVIPQTVKIPQVRPAPPQTARLAQALDKQNKIKNKKAKKGGNAKIAVVSTVAATVILVAVAIPTIRWLFPQLTEWQSPSIMQPAASGTPAPSANTLEVYETRLFSDARGEYDNVLIKRSNLSVKNISVADNIVITDVVSPGEIILEDITVGGAISLQNCAADSLVLRNVAASRIVIDNPSAKVSLSIGGYGIVDTLEIRSPAAVSSIPTLGAGIDNVMSVMLRASPESQALNVELQGMQIQTLASFGETILELGEDTTVERLTSEGSISISGTGRVLSMSATPVDQGGTLVLNIEAPVNGLDLKGAAQLSVSGQIDSLVAEQNLSIAGSGRISTMLLNPPLGGGRLMLDLYDIGVTSLIANAETRVFASGSARINELTANESVYALGNKVNMLMVNADGVIYEQAPDKIQTAPGIRTAETMADNPGLDYNISAALTSLPEGAAGEGTATVCGHSLEDGGFLTGEGTEAAPYQVTDAAQLAHVEEHLDAHFAQTADIDLGAGALFATGFPMLGGGGTPFSGSYNGMGYRILNLRISSNAENVGMFAENTGVIQNVHIASGEVRGTASSRNFVGGICGLNYQDGAITACSNSARVIGGTTSYVGGIAGYNYTARIKDCYNAAKITGISNVGGITGVNRDGGSISGSYNVGTIDGGETDTGGVAGVNTSGVITNCYYLTDTAKTGIGIGGGTAVEKGTDAMSSAQMVADLAAGNEATLWAAGSGGYSYPMLRQPGSAAQVEAPAQTASQPPPQSQESVQAPQTPPSTVEPEVRET